MNPYIVFFSGVICGAFAKPIWNWYKKLFFGEG